MWSYFIRNALLLVERGFYNLLEGFNHHIGNGKKSNPYSSVFVDESYVFEAAECERIEGWGYRLKKYQIHILLC